MRRKMLAVTAAGRAAATRQAIQRGAAALQAAVVHPCGARALAAATGSVRDASSLVLAEHDNKNLNPATLAAVTAAKGIGGEVCKPSLGAWDIRCRLFSLLVTLTNAPVVRAPSSQGFSRT